MEVVVEVERKVVAFVGPGEEACCEGPEPSLGEQIGGVTNSIVMCVATLFKTYPFEQWRSAEHETTAPRMASFRREQHLLRPFAGCFDLGEELFQGHTADIPL